MKQIRSSASHQRIFYPDEQDSAAAVGNEGVDAVATTKLILYFEEVCAGLVFPYMEADEVTVGTHVNVDHLAPANCHDKIFVCAELSNREGRRLQFNVTAVQSGTTIMKGVHYRAVMPGSRFRGSAKNKTPTESKPIEFWFDFHSPWCYFASRQIGDVAREFNLELHWRPVHLANLITAIDGRKPLEQNHQFVSWYKQDLLDTAESMNLAYCPHKEYPKRPSRALRAAICADENGLAEPFITTVMQGYWSEQRDISDIGFLAEAAKSVGLDGPNVESAAVSEEYKEKLGDNLTAAIDRCIFGLPTMVIEGKRYFGNDRIALLREHLKNPL